MIKSMMNKYEMPCFNVSKIKGDNIFILGIGGGSDVVGAYGLASIIKTSNPKSLVNFGLCVSKKTDYTGFKKINNSLYQRDNPQSASNNPHTSLKLIGDMASVGSHLPNPYILSRLPKYGKISKKYSLLEFYQELYNEFLNALNFINPDVVIAIDMGGDSLTCGVEDENSFDISGLKTLKKIGKPFIYIIFGIGCDGESTVEMITNALEKEYVKNSLLGEFSLSELIDLTGPISKSILNKDRTPNIIADAQSTLDKSGDGMITIPRHIEPQIPLSWLVKGIAFNGLKLSTN
ncbi:MAG: DUF1152 domain-containing protein [Ekhidna sp.]|nr:DUF1152 domain-containing protein [Ekhidna sp.]